MMCINDLKYGDKVFVEDIVGSSKLNKRLLALGCIKGTDVYKRQAIYCFYKDDQNFLAHH